MSFKNERERNIVLFGGVVVALLLYLGVFILPVMDQIKKDRRLLATQEQNLQEARRLGGELLGLQAAAASASPESPTVAVDRITRTLGIQEHVNYVRPFGADSRGVEVKLDELDGGSSIRLLFSLAQAGIRPESMEMRDFKGQGLWTMTLTIASRRPGGTP